MPSSRPGLTPGPSRVRARGRRARVTVAAGVGVGVLGLAAGLTLLPTLQGAPASKARPGGLAAQAPEGGGSRIHGAGSRGESTGPGASLTSPQVGGGRITPATTLTPTGRDADLVFTSPADVRVPGGSGSLVGLFRIPTREKVVFLTIDDGLVRDPSFLTHLLDSGVPVTIFPTGEAAAGGRAFFTPMLAAGASLGDHSVTHPDLRGLESSAQQREICAAAGLEAHVLGVRPRMFRPPYGAYNPDTQQVARSCGLQHELLWDATVNDGVVRNWNGVVDAAHPLQGGDIILMHFRTTFIRDFDGAIAAVRASHLQLGVLPAYLATTPTPAGQVRAQEDALRASPYAQRLLAQGERPSTREHPLDGGRQRQGGTSTTR